MIEQLVADAAADRHRDLFLVTPDKEVTYKIFFARLQRVRAALESLPAQHFACHLPDSPELIALILGAAAADKSMLLLSADFSSELVEDYLTRFNVDILFCDRAVAGEDNRLDAESWLAEFSDDTKELSFAVDSHNLSVVESGGDADTGSVQHADSIERSGGELRILTSGTTGEPKCARYHWRDLLQQIKPYRATADERWLLAYHLNHFAGIQMLAHAVLTRATLILPEATGVADNIRAMFELKATHVSASPTFWRFALAQLAGDADTGNLRQITLGSEAVSQHLLDTLQARFPHCRIAHIYASTEDGSCVSVADGRAGLPVSILQRPDNARVRFKVEEGELLISSRHGMLGYTGSDQHRREDQREDGWRATGDLVEVRDDRINFLGRRSEIVNVGGVKVYPLEVEAVVSELPAVKLVRAYGQDNPVVGQIVALDIVLDEGWEEKDAEETVRQACSVLPRHSVPRSINFVATIDTANTKLSRRQDTDT